MNYIIASIRNNTDFWRIENSTSSLFQTGALLQVLVFSQALVYATLFWSVTGSAESALYGFMFGSFSTIIATTFQCHKNRCERFQLPVKNCFKRCVKTFFWFVKPGFTFAFFIYHSVSIA